MAELRPGDLTDPVALTRALVDIESVSGAEQEIADAVQVALASAAHLTVARFGNTVMARTDLGRPQRVVLAGHLDTVPVAGNLPSTVDGGVMYGCGTSDMKSGTAVAMWLALTVPEPRHDVTYFFYECEEVEEARNGLSLVATAHPDWLAADFAVLLEPTDGRPEAGCQGTVRAVVSTTGRRAHAARPWLGSNAIHAAGEVLARLSEHPDRTVDLEGCQYREALSAVRIAGGVAGNVIPDRCDVEVNFRYAPDRTLDQAKGYLRQMFADYAVEVVDGAPAASPGLSAPAAADFVTAIGLAPMAKLGWTDVARFAALGIPAINFGPGDPRFAHTQDEQVEISKIKQSVELLRRWLTV